MASLIIRLIVAMPFGLVANYVADEYGGLDGFKVWLCGWVLISAGSLVVWALTRGNNGNTPNSH